MASIRTARDVAAPAALVHDLLVDVAAWGLWSPHVARVDPPEGRVAAGERRRVRPWFGPPTSMDVETVTAGRGMTWSTPAARHVLRYTQDVEPTGGDSCRVTFSATVDGPVGALATSVASPLSALGQRRRLARLAALAELLHAREAGAGSGGAREHASPAEPGPDFAKRVGTADFWDERYRGTQGVWSGRPNPWLVQEVADLPPGTACDVACGEGADALWLARQGWTVTGVDVSQVGLDRAARLTADAGREASGRLTWARADVTSGPVPGGPYDLVTAHFLHLPPALMAPAQDALRDAVAPGGTLLVVLHSVSDLQTTVRRPPLPEMFPAAGDLAASLDPQEWEVLVAQARPRRQRDPEGRDVTVHDEVLRARRRR